jgi:hypothetical protein
MEIFVGVSDTAEVYQMHLRAKLSGAITGYPDEILDVVKRLKPESVTIGGATLRTCIRHVVEECLEIGIKEVVVDLRKCRTGATIDVGDNPTPEQLRTRRLALTSWLGETTNNDPRLNIIP